MTTSCTVEIAEVSTVSPPSSGLQESFSLPLTFLDLFWLKFPPVERVYFYKLTEATPDYFNSVMLPRLKHSLSLTLMQYLPLAGHVEWPPNSPTPIILLSPDHGVSLTIAVSDADLDRLSGDEPRDAVDSLSYVPELSASETKISVIALQITLFPCKGFSIGYAINHCVLDGKSITMFMKSWAYICTQLGNEQYPKSNSYLLPEELVPCFDRSMIKDPLGLQEAHLNQWAILSGEDWIKNPRSLKLLPQIAVQTDRARATFELSREDLTKLKKRVLSQLTDPTIRLTSFVLASAYVFVCMVKARGGDSNRQVALVVSADCRNRLNPPLPANYFGNCIYSEWFHDAIAKDFMEENGLVVALEKIGSIIMKLDKKLFVGAKEILLNTIKLIGEGVQVISIAGSPRFDVYRTDFGWGKPRKAEVISINRTGAFSLNEGRDGNGGIEIGLALTRHEMKTFASLFVNGLKDM